MTTSRRVLVLGADGFLGWPLALYLAHAGHQVSAVDNLARRGWDQEYGTRSLVPIRSMEQRVAVWAELTGEMVHWHQVDLCDAESLDALVAGFQPDAVVHLAEQRSTMLSMNDQEHTVRTQTNNIMGNLNLLFSLQRHVPDCHLIKLGSMAEPGYPDIDIDEGHSSATHGGRGDRLPRPTGPEMLGHLSQVVDSQNIALTCRKWGIRATTLNQGIVYGIETPETAHDPALATRFDYDPVWGIALNRFCVQAVSGRPLTIYGNGNQTRPYIDIRDATAGIRLALDDPARPGECRLFNQFTEQFNLNQLAGLVARCWDHRGAPVEIRHLPDPLPEAEEHSPNGRSNARFDLGPSPYRLGELVVDSVLQTVLSHAHRIDPVLLEEPTSDGRANGNRASGHGRATESVMAASVRSAEPSAGAALPSERSSEPQRPGRRGHVASSAGSATGNGSAAIARRGRVAVTGIVRTLETRVLNPQPVKPTPLRSESLHDGARGGGRPRPAALGPAPGTTSRRRALVVATLVVAAVVAVPLTIKALDSAAKSISAVVEPTNQVNLNFQNSGPLAAIMVRSGQRVTKGQVVATQAGTSEATAVANDQATLAAAETELNQLEQLLKVDYNAIAQVHVVRADISRDQAQLAVDKQRQSQMAAQTSLVSPVDGLVVAVSGTPGETVDSMGVRIYRPQGTAVSGSPSLQLFPSAPNDTNSHADPYAPVVTIDQWPRWQVTAQVPESQISSVHPGEHAVFSLAALKGSKLACEVTQIVPNPLSVGGSVAYDVRLRLEQGAPQGVLPGMTGSVVLQPRR